MHAMHASANATWERTVSTVYVNYRYCVTFRPVCKQCTVLYCKRNCIQEKINIFSFGYATSYHTCVTVKYDQYEYVQEPN